MVKRVNFEMGCIVPVPDGQYVSYEDYQALIQWMKDTVKELETRQDGWPVFLIEKKLKELGEWNEKV